MLHGRMKRMTNETVENEVVTEAAESAGEIVEKVPEVKAEEAEKNAGKPKKPVSKGRRIVRKILAIVGCVLGVIILVVVAYAAYLFMAYNRVGDAKLEPSNRSEKTFETGKEYKIVSYNIGFAAYEDDFGFFMDGGTEGRGWSKERVVSNLTNIANVLKSYDADIYYIQEIDVDSTRSYHVDQRPCLTDTLSDMSYVYAQNWDSPYLWLPIVRPHGAANTGIMIFADAKLGLSERYELPVESGFMKLIDLDRCYQKSHIALKDGKELVLYNFHLSAYTSDGKIATEQLKELLTDFDKEVANGNYCIAGGDFNKDLLGDSSVYFGKGDKEYNWAQPIPEGVLENSKATLVVPFDKSNPVPSSRNADGPYHAGQYVITIDGFMVSPNITAVSSNVIDTQFKYSDHNPVEMTFILN